VLQIQGQTFPLLGNVQCMSKKENFDWSLGSAFLWRYEPVRRTRKSDDWLTIFVARIIRFTVQKFQLFWVIFCIIIFSIELWHILILWLAKMPNGGMPVFTLIATGWRYRKIFFYKKSTVLRYVVALENCSDESHSLKRVVGFWFPDLKKTRYKIFQSEPS